MRTLNTTPSLSSTGLMGLRVAWFRGKCSRSERRDDENEPGKNDFMREVGFAYLNFAHIAAGDDVTALPPLTCTTTITPRTLAPLPGDAILTGSVITAWLHAFTVSLFAASKTPPSVAYAGRR